MWVFAFRGITCLCRGHGTPPITSGLAQLRWEVGGAGGDKRWVELPRLQGWDEGRWGNLKIGVLI